MQLHKKIERKSRDVRFSDRHTYFASFSIVAHFERPSLRISSFQSDESSLPLSPSRRAARQSGTSRSSESLGTPDAAVNVPTSPSSSAVKEEPCDIDKVFIQWEISPQEDGDTQEPQTPADNRNLSHFFYANMHNFHFTFWNVNVLHFQVLVGFWIVDFDKLRLRQMSLF